LIDQAHPSISYVLLSSPGNTTSAGSNIGLTLYSGGSDWAGFSYNLDNQYTKPARDSYSQFSVQVTIVVGYNSSYKRGILQDTNNVDSADAETQLVFAATAEPVDELDVVLIAVLSSIGGAIIIIAIILLIIYSEQVMERLETRHDTAKKLTNELMEKFSTTPGDLRLTSPLPSWIPPWQIPISKTDMVKYQKDFKKQKKKFDKEGKTNIKVVNQIRIGDWILERIGSYGKIDDTSSSSSSSQGKKKKSKKASKKTSKKRVKKRVKRLLLLLPLFLNRRKTMKRMGMNKWLCK